MYTEWWHKMPARRPTVSDAIGVTVAMSDSGDLRSRQGGKINITLQNSGVGSYENIVTMTTSGTYNDDLAVQFKQCWQRCYQDDHAWSILRLKIAIFTIIIPDKHSIIMFPQSKLKLLEFPTGDCIGHTMHVMPLYFSFHVSITKWCFTFNVFLLRFIPL